ncbi:MAG: hypothetical protein GY846_00900 [Deltaproteobacteria bacterium]|nr:hypothetical protein [Deltaproteobacteria bacterium]
MSYKDPYQSRKLSPQKVVAPIKNESTLLVAMAAGEPPALMEAVTGRVG